MSVIGSKVPGRSNSRVVPTASPVAKPSKHPRKRSDLLHISYSVDSAIAASVALSPLKLGVTSLRSWPP